MDSITKADGMDGVRLVHFPGSVRVVLDGDALTLIADALDRYVADLDRGAQGRVGETWDIQRGEAGAAALLAALMRARVSALVDMDGDDDNARGIVAALVDAGAQA